MTLVDFDEIDVWAPSLGGLLCDILPEGFKEDLVSQQPEYVEDAQKLLFDMGDRDAIIDRTLEWLSVNTIVGYHGTRLTPEGVDSVRQCGLRPLDASARRDRIERALSQHPQWNNVGQQLDEALNAHGKGQFAGNREGQVHLTLSRSGLVSCFNHYLVYGSEFDQHVAHSLLGDEGIELLRGDGASTLFRFGVPGARALEAGHIIFSIDDVRRRGDVPNIANEFLKAWSFSLAYPGFNSNTLRVDCGLVFHEPVPADWLLGDEAI